LSNADCLEDKQDECQSRTLYRVPQLCNYDMTHLQTFSKYGNKIFE